VNATTIAFVALLVIAGSTARWFQLALSLRLPEKRGGFVLAWAVGALLGVVALVQGAAWGGAIAAGLAVFVGSFLLFTAAIGPQLAAPNAVRVGEPLREFTAPDESGEPFELANLAGGPVLLKFFRGHW
jgi:hypothetical protein